MARVEALERYVTSNRIPGAPGLGDRNLAKTILDMEIYVTTLIGDPPTKVSEINSIIENKMKTEIEMLIDSKLRTAMQFSKVGNRDEGGGQSWYKSVLESKAAQEIGTVVDAKQYRQWNKKMKNAIDQIRPNSRNVLDHVEKLTEDEINEAIKQGNFDSRRDAIINMISNKRGGNQDLSDLLRTLNVDMWAILSAKAEGEAEEKLESCTQGEGLWAYIRVHSWFTRTTDQGRSMRRAAIMQPPKCTHEHEISAAIERWEEKYRALREDDREMELPDSWKMIALRMMLCGEIQKSVEYREKEFKTYEELRAVVMKWAINRKIENERAQHDPMDCNHAQGPEYSDPNWNWTQGDWPSGAQEGTPEGSPQDVNYMNHKGKGGGKGDSKGGKGPSNYNPLQYHFQMMMKAMKGGGKGYSGPPYSGQQQQGPPGKGGKGGGKSDNRSCYNCGAQGHIARNCPHPKKGQSGVATREVAINSDDDDVCWGTCVIEELQDVDAANETRTMTRQEEQEALNVIRKTKAETPKGNSNPPWRKKIPGGHRIKFVLDSGAVKTIVPKDALPDMKLDKRKGGSFRVASGEVLPNLGSTKLKGVGTLSGSPMTIGTQVAEITKPLASVDEMVANGMMVIMHRTGGLAKRLDIDTERKIRDLVKSTQGNEVVLERAGGSFTFEIDVKSDEWKEPKKTVRPSNQKMQVDEVAIKSYFDALWNEPEYEELECGRCESTFHRH